MARCGDSHSITRARVAAFATLALAFGDVGCADSSRPPRPPLSRMSNHGLAVTVRARRQLILLWRATVDSRSLRAPGGRQRLHRPFDRAGCLRSHQYP
jgi:hypothetical protein